MSRKETRDQLGGELVYSGAVFDIINVVDTATNRSMEFALANDSVRAYPIDAEGNVWLASEIRPGLSSEPILRAASGSIEDNDADVVAAALREASEELGIAGGTGEVFHTSTASLKLLNTVSHVAIKGWHKGKQHLEESEKIEVRVIPLAQVPDLVWSGRIVEDAVALALLKLHHQMLVE